MRKTYILDTNVLMYEPKSLFAFEDNEVVIPLVVLDELDKHKGGDSQVAKHARMAIRSLDELRALGKLNEGVLTERGGTIKVELNNGTCTSPGFTIQTVNVFSILKTGKILCLIAMSFGTTSRTSGSME